jgi:hypothetical protein
MADLTTSNQSPDLIAPWDRSVLADTSGEADWSHAPVEHQMTSGPYGVKSVQLVAAPATSKAARPVAW